MSAMTASRGLLIGLAVFAALIMVIRVSGFGKVVIWSAMKGRVLLDGRPVAGAVVTREYFWHWPSERGSDRVTTNAEGEFSFPTVEGRSISASLLPHEPVIEQLMTVQYLDKSYKAWGHAKHNYELNRENGGRPIDVTCRLGAERVMHGDVFGLCEFN